MFVYIDLYEADTPWVRNHKTNLLRCSTCLVKKRKEKEKEKERCTRLNLLLGLNICPVGIFGGCIRALACEVCCERVFRPREISRG
jgi:hypothetical protein